MGRRTLIATVGALALAAVAGGGSLAIGSAGADGETIHADVIASEARIALLDFDDDGRIDTGERATGNAPLKDRETGVKVGRTFFECVATTRIVPQSQGMWVCTYVLRLQGGHIIIQGRDPAGFGAYVFAVTGGTGLYRNARGQANLADVPAPDRTEITVHLEP